MKDAIRILAATAALASTGLALSAPSTAWVGVKSMPLAPSATPLYSQLGDDSGAGYTSQDFEATYDSYDSRAADDFTVPSGIKWKVDRVTIAGSYTNEGMLTSANVTFYKDRSGKPGAVLADFPGAAITSDLHGTITVALPSRVTLSAGTYWMSVQGVMDYAIGGQWYTHVRWVTDGNGAKWQNPGDGFGLGCIKYADLNRCMGVSMGDLAFELGGKARPTR